MRLPHIIGLAFMGIGLAVVAKPVFAQDVNTRLRQLENQLQTLNRAVYRGEVPASGGSDFGAGNTGNNLQAAQEVRLGQLETEIRNLTGKLEEQSFKLDRLENQLTRLAEDIQIRLSDLEQGGGAAQDSGTFRTFGTPETAPSAGELNRRSASSAGQGGFDSFSQPPQAQNTGSSNRLGSLSSAPASTNTPDGAYDAAFSSLRSENYAQAQDGFRRFIESFPNHPLASNAHYWLAETYYVQGDYDQSARLFAEAYQKYPDGNKAPDNLLKLGLSLAAQGNTDDACVALGQLTRDNPSNALPVVRKAEQEMGRIGCL